VVDDPWGSSCGGNRCDALPTCGVLRRGGCEAWAAVPDPDVDTFPALMPPSRSSWDFSGPLV